MNQPILLAAAIVCALVFFLLVLLLKPVRGLCMLLLHSVAGWVGLYIFNTIFAFTNFAIGVNFASATILGILGLPGLIFMVLAKWMMGF